MNPGKRGKAKNGKRKRFSRCQAKEVRNKKGCGYIFSVYAIIGKCLTRSEADSLDSWHNSSIINLQVGETEHHIP
jgi:hypothetical protein